MSISGNDEYEQLIDELAKSLEFQYWIPGNFEAVALDQVGRCRGRGYSAKQARHIVTYAPGRQNVGDLMNLIEAVKRDG